MDNIVNFKSYKDAVNKFDGLAKPVMPKLNTVFPDESIADKMKRFFDVADGNSIWDS